MLLLDLTFPDPPSNLAADEALLDLCDRGEIGGVLRFWAPQNYFVVLGYANHVRKEVHIELCQSRGIPILRRCSGGGTVLQGEGCLNYALILRIREGEFTETIVGTNRHVMEQQARALETLLGAPVQVRGCTDLAMGTRKFSGNAQRRKRNALIFHGTLLLRMNLELMGELLQMPSQEPDYRFGRSHAEFLTNIHVSADDAKAVIARHWKATQMFSGKLRIEGLLEKYLSSEWNSKF